MFHYPPPSKGTPHQSKDFYHEEEYVHSLVRSDEDSVDYADGKAPKDTVHDALDEEGQSMLLIGFLMGVLFFVLVLVFIFIMVGGIEALPQLPQAVQAKHIHIASLAV